VYLHVNRRDTWRYVEFSIESREREGESRSNVDLNNDLASTLGIEGHQWGEGLCAETLFIEI